MAPGVGYSGTVFTRPACRPGRFIPPEYFNAPTTSFEFQPKVSLPLFRIAPHKRSLVDSSLVRTASLACKEFNVVEKNSNEGTVGTLASYNSWLLDSKHSFIARKHLEQYAVKIPIVYARPMVRAVFSSVLLHGAPITLVPFAETHR